jgi:predicted transcriptional regulator
MDLLWDHAGPMTVRAVVDELAHERAIAYTTVMTVMDNLHTKQLLHRHLRGRAYCYAPVVSRQEHSAQLMRQALDASDDRVGAFVHFMRQMTAEDAKALQDAYHQVIGDKP